MTSGNKNTHVERWITLFHISRTLVLASQNHLKPEGNLPQIPVELTKTVRHRYHKGVLDIKRVNYAYSQRIHYTGCVVHMEYYAMH